ncbi:hypothetical protein EIP86_007354 [Pleurotus ostreatoroseus]|nr:hypothetical protein EIP86_007354 [Pleurotus ostreatoroseus]
MAPQPTLFHDSADVVRTSINFDTHLRSAIFAASIREDSGFDDAEGAEIWTCSDPTGLEGPLSPLTTPPSSREATPHQRTTSLPDPSPSGLQSAASTATAEQLPGVAPHQGRRISPAEKQRQRAHKAAQRRRKRAAKRMSQDAWDYAPPLSILDKFKDVAHVQCDISVRDFSRAQGAWIGINPRTAEDAEDDPWTLEELLAAGFQLHPWDGRAATLLTDKNGRGIGGLVGRPANDDTWDRNAKEIVDVLTHAGEELRFGRYECLPVPSGGCEDNRRGGFATAAVGVSFGGGQTVPGNLKHTVHNQRVLDDVLQSNCIRRALKYGSNSLAFYAPKLYKYYARTSRRLHAHHPRLRRIYKGTVFPALSLNFGPQAICVKHKDHNNLADGLCWILSLGDFDPKCGGHLVLWELGLVIEFPPGSCVLIPSAVISHSNVPIRPHETRLSMTQYAAGGLFRWVEYGYATWDDFLEREPVRAKAMKKSRATRWRKAVTRFSKLQELHEDRVKVFAQ